MMLRYIRNVFWALIGKVPIMDAKEREELIKEVSGREAQKSHDEIVRYQRLIENLRERIESTEKRCKTELADLHACYKQQVEKLRQELQQANSAIGRELMSKQMLEKTNSTLNDLCIAMSEYDSEMVLAASESYDWSSSITRIAQYYLTVLRRKQELENRLMANQDNFNFD